MKIIKIPEEHYGAPLSWVVNCDEKEFFELVKKYGFDRDYADSLGADGHFLTGEGYSIIWIRQELPPEKYILTLSHELIHYVIETLERKGIPVNYDNQEDIAYFHEKMLKRCMAVNLKKYLKK